MRRLDGSTPKTGGNDGFCRGERERGKSILSREAFICLGSRLRKRWNAHSSTRYFPLCSSLATERFLFRQRASPLLEEVRGNFHRRRKRPVEGCRQRGGGGGGATVMFGFFSQIATLRSHNLLADSCHLSRFKGRAGAIASRKPTR